MRVFVAGATGVLGRALVPLLLDAGHEVCGMTRSPGKAEELRATGATPVVADALDRERVAAALVGERPDAVVHLLTDLTVGDPASNAHLRRVGTRNLVDAAREADARRMVSASISWVYRPALSPADEDDPLDVGASEPRHTTIAGVQALEQAVREMPEAVVLRFGQLYGPGTWYSRAGRFGAAAAEGRLEATETVTSFIHAADAARAAFQALAWPSGTYNVVDDEPAPGLDWAPHFARQLGAPEPSRHESGDVGRPVSNARARKEGLTLDHPTWRDGFRTL